MLAAFVAVGLTTGVLVDLAERLFGADPGASRAGAGCRGDRSWLLGQAARLIDAIVWQALVATQIWPRVPPPRAYNDDGSGVDDWGSGRVYGPL